MKAFAWWTGVLVLALSACLPAAPSAAIPSNGRAKGNPNAPLTLVVYSDFQ